MPASRFRLKLATLKPGVRYVSLQFSNFVDCPRMALSDPVISEACGEELDYGRLFAYCFRRFGYPNRGWDDYKELAKYILATPLPDMYLCIVPYVGNTASLSISFLVPESAHRAFNEYARRDRDAWESRSLAWAEMNGLPEWMPEWVTFCNTEVRAAFQREAAFLNWRETLPWMCPLGAAGSPLHAATKRAHDFRQQLHESYSQVEPYPAYYDRPLDRCTWQEDDPLKPYANAAVVALRDLQRAVGVRDQAINAFGKVDDDRADVKRAVAAGYPAGELANTAPQEFAQLHGLINGLGKGNAKRGIARVMRALKAAGMC